MPAHSWSTTSVEPSNPLALGCPSARRGASTPNPMASQLLTGARSYREGCVAYEGEWLPEHLVGDDPGEPRKVHESLRGPSKSVPLRIAPVVLPEIGRAHV